MMKTIFDPITRNELITRINTLKENGRPLWGKMNRYQMIRHCVLWNEWILGVHQQGYKQGLLGKVFGKMALRSNTKDDRPIGRNMPAGKAFTIKELEGDLDQQQEKWVQLIADYAHFSNEAFVHDFFGKMTKDQIGIFVYKHMDHHLRQFGV